MKTKKVIEDANTITDGLVSLINLSGNYAGRINTTGIFDPVHNIWRKLKETELGKSDIIACIRGKFVAIEIKFGKDTQKRRQKSFEKRVLQAGGVYYQIHTWEEAEQWWADYADK